MSFDRFQFAARFIILKINFERIFCDHLIFCDLKMTTRCEPSIGNWTIRQFIVNSIALIAPQSDSLSQVEYYR